MFITWDIWRKVSSTASMPTFPFSAEFEFEEPMDVEEDEEREENQLLLLPVVSPPLLGVDAPAPSPPHAVSIQQASPCGHPLPIGQGVPHLLLASSSSCPQYCVFTFCGCAVVVVVVQEVIPEKQT